MNTDAIFAATAGLVLAATLAGCAPGTVAGGVAAAGPTSCVLHELTSVRADVADENDGVIVAAAIDGQNAEIGLGTGPTVPFITQGFAERMHLPLGSAPGDPVRATFEEGHIEARDTIIDNLSVGAISVGRFHAMVRTSVYQNTDDRDPHRIAWEAQVAGTLGPVFLSRYDVEFDLGAHRVVFYQPNDCAGPLLPWAGTVLSTAFGRLAPPPSGYVNVINMANFTNGLPIEVPARVNGAVGAVSLNSLNHENRLSLEAAVHLGIAPGSPGVVDLGFRHYTGYRVHRWSAVVASIAFGGETMRDVPVTIYDSGGRDNFLREVALGVDFFKAHRICIDYHNHVLYFTPYSFLDLRR